LSIRIHHGIVKSFHQFLEKDCIHDKEVNLKSAYIPDPIRTAGKAVAWTGRDGEGQDNNKDNEASSEDIT